MFFPDQVDRHRALIEEALALALDRDDQLWAARARYQLGFNLMHQQRWDEAREAVIAVIPALRDVADTVHVAAATNSLAEIYLHLGQIDQAQRHAIEALTLAQRVQFDRGIIWSTSALTNALVAGGNLAGAIALIREGVALAAKRHDLVSLSMQLADAANIAMALNQPLDSAKLLGAAKATFAALGVVFSWVNEREDQLCRSAIPLIGARAFTQAVEAGRVVDLDEAVNLVEDLCSSRSAGHGNDRP